MKIVFLGTPEFAVPVLEAIHHSKYKLLAVVTQPDRPKGRHLKSAPSPVKEKALELGYPLFQPENVSEPDFMDQIRQFKPDVAVVVAFGQIFKKDLLELPSKGCWNVHASLLPKYRGALPVARAIMDGENETGASIMRMSEGIDNGPVLMKVKVPISSEMTAGELEEILSNKGAELMIQGLELIEKGEPALIPQDDSLATYAKKLKKEEAKIDWSQPAQMLHNKIRGLNPNPGAYTLWKGERLKIWKSKVISSLKGSPGKCLENRPDSMVIAAGDAALSLIEIQLPGKKKMDIRQFSSGHLIQPGDQFE